MGILETNSLAITIDNLTDAFFYGRNIPSAEKLEIAKWIAGRQGEKGSYSGLPAPTAYDFSLPVKLFTGEIVKTRAARAHILGEEAMTALYLLDVKNPYVKTAMKNASELFSERIGCPKPGTGYYCCGLCTPWYWRHLSAGGYSENGWNAKEISRGMKILKGHRDGKGRWRRFPFYCTLFALLDIDDKGAVGEIKYAAPSIERYLKRGRRGDKISSRRYDILEKVLGRI